MALRKALIGSFIALFVSFLLLEYFEVTTLTNYNSDICQVSGNEFLPISERNVSFSPCFVNQSLTKTNNPKFNPNLITCPRSWSGKEPWKREADLNTEVKPIKTSERTCTEDNYCQYENVCLNGKSVHFYHDSSQQLSLLDFGFFSYRGMKKSFSENYNLRLFPTPRNKNKMWIKGTTLWMDQPFSNVSISL
jgi:hypothetical protein